MQSLPPFETLSATLNGDVLVVAIDQPDNKNALSAKVRGELSTLCDFLESASGIRILVLRSSHGVFCAGGDLRDFKRNITLPAPAPGERDAIAVDNRKYGDFLLRFNRLPQTTVCAVEGPAFGGALGLICVCDVALAMADARFAVSETSLGVIPAQIAPFVVQRIGLTQSRRLALTGLRFDGQLAFQVGLVHAVCTSPEDMQAQLNQVIAQIKRCSPVANAKTKELLLRSANAADVELMLDWAADGFAEVLRGEEGQAGVNAFLAKRAAPWVPIK